VADSGGRSFLQSRSPHRGIDPAHRRDRSVAHARRVFRTALMGSALAAVLTAWASMAPALAHGHRLKKMDEKHARQSDRITDTSGHQRRILRDKLVASASRSQSSAQTLLASSGIASVYSDHHTASGEQMNSGAMTAAHRTLPFGTKVTVVNRSNGRSAVVRINDRGPFVYGRVIDLSPAAAQALEVNGLAPVSLIVESGVDDEQNGKLANGAKEKPPQSANPSLLKVSEPVQVAE
jgi:rare lipoprotein A